MVIIIFTFIVYVFFVYGLIEFSKKLYVDVAKRHKSYNPPVIKVLLDNQEDVEYTVRSLQGNYNKIIIFLTTDIEIPKTIDKISNDIDIEFKYFKEERG